MSLNASVPTPAPYEGKTYHVYGMGNALVDMEFEVPENFLSQLKIEKGIMSLVDEERQAEILRRLGNMHAKKKACGGSAANTMIALAQLGGQGFYAHKVGLDSAGSFYQNDLKENGVNFCQTRGRADGTTGSCLVMITPDADRTMNTYLGITQSFSEEQVNEADLQKSSYLYIEGYLFATAQGRRSMIKAKAFAKSQGIKIVLSFSDPFIVRTFREQIFEFLGDGIDFIFCNEREAFDLWEVHDLSGVCESMKKVCKGFAITLGAKGACIFDGKSYCKINPYPVQAVDTNGAGDMFAGAFLYGLVQGFSYQRAGDLASKASSVLVTQFGPRLTKEQTQKILREMKAKWEVS